MVIECIGLPGSGKSYLTDCLCRALRHDGYRCVNVSALCMTNPAVKAARKLMHACIWLNRGAVRLRGDMEQILAAEEPIQSRFGIYENEAYTLESAAIFCAVYPRMMRSDTIYLFDEGLVHTLIKYCADGLLADKTLQDMCARTERAVRGPRDQREAPGRRIVIDNYITVEDCMYSIAKRDRHVCDFDELEGPALREILQAYERYNGLCAGFYGAIRAERRAPMRQKLRAIRGLIGNPSAR